MAMKTLMVIVALLVSIATSGKFFKFFFNPLTWCFHIATAKTTICFYNDFGAELDIDYMWAKFRIDPKPYSVAPGEAACTEVLLYIMLLLGNLFTIKMLV